MSFLDKLHRNDQVRDKRPEAELRKLFGKGKRKEREHEEQHQDDNAAERLAHVALTGNPIDNAARAIVGGADPIAPIARGTEVGGRLQAGANAAARGDLSAVGGPNIAGGIQAATQGDLSAVGGPNIAGGVRAAAQGDLSAVGGPSIAGGIQAATQGDLSAVGGPNIAGRIQAAAAGDLDAAAGPNLATGPHGAQAHLSANIGGFDVHVDAKANLENKKPALDVNAGVDGKLAAGAVVQADAEAKPLAKKKSLEAHAEVHGHGAAGDVDLQADITNPDVLAKKKQLERSANIGGFEVGGQAGGRFEAVHDGLSDRNQLGKQVVDAGAQAVTNGDLMWNAVHIVHKQSKDEAHAESKKKKGGRLTQLALGDAEDKLDDKKDDKAVALKQESANDKDQVRKKAKGETKDTEHEAKHDVPKAEGAEHEEEEHIDGKMLPGKVGKLAKQAHDDVKESDGHTKGVLIDGKQRLEQKTLTPDGHGMGLDVGPLGPKQATMTPDGHGMGVDLGKDAKSKTDPAHKEEQLPGKHPANTNQKVDGHGTGLDLGGDPLHAKHKNSDDDHTDEIEDAEGEKHPYNAKSGKAPAPTPKGHAGGGFAKPPPKPQLPPPPQTANQQALNAFIEKARTDRDAARKSVQHQQLAKSTAITVSATHVASQVKAKNDAKLGEIKKQADATKEKAAQEAAEKKQTDGPVTIESLKTKLEATATEDKAKLQADFDAKAAELKTRIESQKAVLQEQTTAQIANYKKEQDAKKKDAEKAFEEQKKSLTKTRDDLLVTIRKSVADDQAKLEKEMAKDGKLWVAANARMATIEKTWQDNKKTTHDNGYKKADDHQNKANTDAGAERGKGDAAANAITADYAKKAAEDGADASKLRAEGAAKAKAAKDPYEAKAKNLETKGKLDNKAMKADVDKACAKIEDDGKKAKDAVSAATANQVKAIETKIQDLGKIADGRIKKAEDDLKTKLAAGEKKLTDSLKGSEDKINELKKAADDKIAKLETESLTKLQTTFDAAMTALDKRVAAAQKQLATGNEKNIKALEKMVDATCKAIDKQVIDTEKKFDATVQDADKKASAHVLAALNAIKLEAEKALAAIDANYQEALKMADDAVAAAHRSMEEAAKGKMLEIEVHVGTMMKDCGDSSRYDAAKSQLEYYIKNKLPIPAGYGESAPSPSEKKDETFSAKSTDAKGKPEDKKDEKKEEVGAEKQKLEDAEKARLELLKPEDLSEAGIKAKVEEAIKNGQKQTSVGATNDANKQLTASMADATDAVTKSQTNKSKEMEDLKAGNKDMLAQVKKQQDAEIAGQAAATQISGAMTKTNWYGGKSPDKKTILKALEGKSPEEIEAMRESLKAQNINIDDFITKEMSGPEQAEARIRMTGDPIAGDIAALKNAGGHQMTGNEKLTIGILGGPSGWITLATQGDQNTGVDKKRLEEILNKYKDDPVKLAAFKKQYEDATGQPLGDLLHRAGNDQLAKDLKVEVPKDERSEKDKQEDGKKEAERLFAEAQKDPKTAGKINPAKVATQAAVINSALNGFHLDSTKTEEVRKALAACSPEEMAYLKAMYKQKTGKDLDRDLEAQLPGAALAEAKATLRNDKETAAVNKILGVEQGGWTPITLDDKQMTDTLKELKDPAERRAVLAAYEKRTGRKLQDVLAEKMTGNDRALAIALADGDTLKARNIELDEATNGGWMNGMHKAVQDRTKQLTGKDIDTEKYTRGIVSAYLNPAGIGDDTKPVTLPGGYVMENGAIHKVDSEKIFEILENTPNPEDRQKIKDLYFQRTGRKLDDDMGTKLVGPMGGQAKLDAYKALDDGRMDDYYAAKMDDAVDGLNDSKAFHKQLEGKSEAERKRIIEAYNRRHPNQPDAFNKMIDEQFGADSMDKKKAKLLAESPDDPMTGSVKLPDKFVLEYSQDSVWNRTAKQIDKVTAVFDKYPMLYAIPGVGSAAGQAKAASYFMRGWGVDKDAIKDVLKNKSKAEIDALKAQYPDLEKDLMYALDGRDAFEVKLMLAEGEPKTDKEKIERRMKLYEFDRGGAGSYLGMNKISNGLTDLISPDGKLMDAEYEAMKSQLAILKEGGTLPPEAQRQLEISLATMDQSTKGFMTAREEMTGAIATAVGAVVGAVVTVLTGGVAGAILAALAAGMATVGTKLVMLGESYGRSEMGVDLAMTAVQMATAGLGGGVTKLSQSFLTQVLNGAIGAAASNFAQTMMTSKDAHDLLGLLAQASKSGLVGLLSGGANSAATAGLATAMGKLSERAFGPNAPLAGIFMKGFVSGAGGSLAGTFAEAMVDPNTLAGNWDQVFAKLARGAAESGFQNGLSEVAETHRDRREAVHARAKSAVEEVQKKNGGNRNVQEEHAAFAKAMAEGYDGIIRHEEAKAKAAKEAEAQPNPDQVQKKLDDNPPAKNDEAKPLNDDPKKTAKEEQPVPGKTTADIKADMDRLAATKGAQEQKSAQLAANADQAALPKLNHTEDAGTAKPNHTEDAGAAKPKHADDAHLKANADDAHAKPNSDDPHAKPVTDAAPKTPEEQHAAKALADEQAKAKAKANADDLDPSKVAKAADGPAPAAGTGQMPAVAPPQHSGGLGLASAAAMVPFVHAMREHADAWPNMNEPQKARVLQDTINAILAQNGLPATTVKAAGGGYGVMNSAQGGGIHISIDRLTHGTLADIVNTAYHEARHLEQWHLAVKHLQASGWTADQIVQKTAMHPGIVQESMNHPGQITVAQMAEGGRFYEGIFGAGAAHREDVYRRKASQDPMTAYIADQQYRALIEERDAYRVGDAAQHAFLHAPAAPTRAPMPNTSGPIEPMPIHGIGGDQSAVVAKPIKPDAIIPIGPNGPEVAPPAHVDPLATTQPTPAQPAQANPSGRSRSNTAPMPIPDSMKTPPPPSLGKHPRSGLDGDGVSSNRPTLHGSAPAPAAHEPLRVGAPPPAAHEPLAKPQTQHEAQPALPKQDASGTRVPSVNGNEPAALKQDRIAQDALAADKKLTTAQAYATVTLPADAAGQKALLRDPENWTPERRAFHDEILARAVADAQKFATAMQSGNPEGDPTLFAMRGNTAAGKTRSIKGGGAPELADAVNATSKDRHRAVNPDNFKLEIYARNPDITASQAHLESSILAERFQKALLEAKTGDGKTASMLIDKRLGEVGDVTKLQKAAESTGRKFSMIDVDAPLHASLAGVLDRVPGGPDPIPPFAAIAEGFHQARAERRAVLDAVASDPNASYKLFATNPDGSKVLVAEIKRLGSGEEMPTNPADRIKIADGMEARFKEMLPKEHSVTEDVAHIKDQKITPELIRDITAAQGKYGQELADKLAKHVGKTWEEAINDWSKAKPEDVAPKVAAAPKQTAPEAPAADGVTKAVDPAKVAIAAQSVHTTLKVASDPTLDTPELRTTRHELHKLLVELGVHTKSNAEIEAAIAKHDPTLARSVRDFLDKLPKNSWGVEAFPKTLHDNDPLLTSTDKKTTTLDGEDRETWRRELVKELLLEHGAQPKGSGEKPVIYIMGGGGASGKGTLKDQLISAGTITDKAVHIDPDGIKERIPEYKKIVGEGDSRAAAVVHEESSQLAKDLLAMSYKNKMDIVYDVTLGNPTKAKAILEKAKAEGYEIRLFGVSVEAETAIQRNLSRAKDSGRYVPPEEQLKAHKGFSRGFEEYAHLADSAELYDTSGDKPNLMAVKLPGKDLQITDQGAFDQFRAKGDMNLDASNVGDLTKGGKKDIPIPAVAPTSKEYVDAAMANLNKSSRTAGGTVDTSAGADKAKSMADISGAEAAKRTKENYSSEIGRLHENKDKQFKGPGDLRAFVEEAAGNILKGVAKDGELVRKHEAKSELPYTPIANLESAMRQFYDEFHQRLNDPKQDPVSLAAWVEYRINLTDHFYADGCGKISAAISAWVLMRKGQALPMNTDRDVTFANAPVSQRKSASEHDEDQTQYQEWENHYRRQYGTE